MLSMSHFLTALHVIFCFHNLYELRPDIHVKYQKDSRHADKHYSPTLQSLYALHSKNAQNKLVTANEVEVMRLNSCRRPQSDLELTLKYLRHIHKFPLIHINFPVT